MKSQHRILLALVAMSLAMPGVAFAAKAERRKDRDAKSSEELAGLDKDGNGSVSESEYVAGMKEKLGGEAAAKSQFASLDKDHDGKLGKDEIASSGAKKKRKRGNN